MINKVKYNGLSILCFLFLFISCKQENKKHAEHVAELYPVDNYLKFDTYNINPETRCLKYYKDHNNNEWLFFVVKLTNSLNIYSLRDGSLFKSLKFQHRGNEGIGNITGVQVYNLDSIVLTSTNHRKLFLINSDGDFLKHMKIVNNLPLGSFHSLSNAESDYNIEFSVNKDSMIVVCNYSQRRDNTLIKNHYQAVTINYKGEVINCIKYPDFNYGKNIDYFHRSTVFSKRGEMVLSFNQSDMIFMYDVKKQEYIRKEAKSQYQTGNLSGRTLRKESIVKSKARYVMNPSYINLVYDKYRDVYYRFYYPGVELKKGDDVQALWRTPKRFSVMILDKDLNVLGETLMSDNQFNCQMYFVAEDGLYISLHYDNLYYDTEWLRFQKFELAVV